MSLATLIRKVSPRAARYVDVDGRLIVVPAGREIVLPDARPAVPPHRFHGGQLSAVKAPPNPWWRSDPARLSDEVRDMARFFPGFVHGIDGSGSPMWAGTINTGRGRFDIEIIHHPDAHRIPRVRVVRPRRLGRHEGWRWRRADHLFVNDDLCVAEDRDWDPAQHNTVTVVCWAAHWLHCYTEWRASGVWPTDGYIPKGY